MEGIEGQQGRCSERRREKGWLRTEGRGSDEELPRREGDRDETVSIRGVYSFTPLPLAK